MMTEHIYLAVFVLSAILMVVSYPNLTDFVATVLPRRSLTAHAFVSLTTGLCVWAALFWTIVEVYKGLGWL